MVAGLGIFMEMFALATGQTDTSREWPNSSFGRCGYENIDLMEDSVQSS